METSATVFRLSKKGMSRSSPSLAAAFNLRQYAIDVRHLSPERKLSTPDLPLEKIDLIGGNGRWRQKKAAVEWDRRTIEDREKRRQQRILEEERRRRKAEQEAKRRRMEEEEEHKRDLARKQEQREKEERERRERELEEKARLRREEEERERLARQPKTCETCAGTGSCTKCCGKGHFFSTFLVSNISKTSQLVPKVPVLDYGRVHQGCDECGGCKHGISGSLRTGTGKCYACKGAGKIRPKVEIQGHRRRTSSSSGVTEPGSPKSPASIGSP